MTPSNPSPDTGAGTPPDPFPASKPLTADEEESLRRTPRMQNVTYGAGRWVATLDAARQGDHYHGGHFHAGPCVGGVPGDRFDESRPATDPAGLEAEWLARAYARLDGRDVATFEDAEDARFMSDQYARLSVADGPGPEERPGDIFDRLMTLWQEPWSERAFGEAQMLLSRLRAALPVEETGRS